MSKLYLSFVYQINSNGDIGASSAHEQSGGIVYAEEADRVVADGSNMNRALRERNQDGNRAAKDTEPIVEGSGTSDQQPVNTGQQAPVNAGKVCVPHHGPSGDQVAYPPQTAVNEWLIDSNTNVIQTAGGDGSSDQSSISEWLIPGRSVAVAGISMVSIF